MAAGSRAQILSDADWRIALAAGAYNKQLDPARIAARLRRMTAEFLERCEQMSEQIYDRLYIGGEWVVPHSGRAIASIDPSIEAVWAEVAEADEQDIDKAVAAAKAAMRGPWK